MIQLLCMQVKNGVDIEVTEDVRSVSIETGELFNIRILLRI